MKSPKLAVLSALCIVMAVALAAVACCLLGCEGAGDGREWHPVPGKTMQIIAVYMHDSDLSDYADMETWFGSNSRVRLDSFVDYLDRPTLRKAPEGVYQIEEPDSCGVRRIREWISEAWDSSYDFHVVYLAGHGGGRDPAEGALAFGPDYHGSMATPPEARSWLDVNELAAAVENLGMDLLVVDACSSLMPPLLDALVGTDVPCVAGSTAPIRTNFMSPQMLSKAWTEHDLSSMSDLCEITWGAYPLVTHVVRDLRAYPPALTARREIDEAGLQIFEPLQD